MNTYYLRCRQSRYDILVRRGVRMGAIIEEEGNISPVGPGAWDYVGVKYPEVPEGEPQGEPSGGAEDPYVHINFRTTHNLRELAMAAAATDLDIATGMHEIASYFIVDAEGNPTAPEFPLRVFL
jgi:hypothetical protein